MKKLFQEAKKDNGESVAFSFGFNIDNSNEIATTSVKKKKKKSQKKSNSVDSISSNDKDATVGDTTVLNPSIEIEANNNKSMSSTDNTVENIITADHSATIDNNNCNNNNPNSEGMVKKKKKKKKKSKDRGEATTQSIVDDMDEFDEICREFGATSLNNSSNVSNQSGNSSNRKKNNGNINKQKSEVDINDPSAPRMDSCKDPILDNETRLRYKYGKGKNLVRYGPTKVRDPRWVNSLNESPPSSSSSTDKGNNLNRKIIGTQSADDQVSGSGNQELFNFSFSL